MTAASTFSIENKSPSTVWEELQINKNSALVDCRTNQEWDVIGTPDLSSINKETQFVEWRKAPDMSINSTFANDIKDAFDGSFPETIFFICRSGARSLEAAAFVQNLLSSAKVECTCVNVAEGFEGDPGPNGIRGTINGWKFNNLPWNKGQG